MIAVHVNNVSVTHVSFPIFEDLSWQIHEGRRIGLIGPNGCGKSTLLRLIAGELKADSGAVVRRSGLSVGYLPQEIPWQAGRTVWQETLTASTALAEAEAALADVEYQLTKPAVYNDEGALTRTLERQARLVERYEELGGPSYRGRVRAILRSLGFSEHDMELPLEALSGGQRKLVGLAKLLLLQPDLLLLDEPDNHLDLERKGILEDLIRGYAGTVVIVSHDRYLLDLVVDEIADLESGRLTSFRGTYSEYAVEKQLRLLRQQQLYQAQQKEIARIEAAIARFEEWARMVDNERHARQARSRRKMLERMDRIERPVLEQKRMGLELPGWRGSDKVLEIEGLTKAFPSPTAPDEETFVLLDLNLLLWRGERAGLVGSNGTGKSLLLRLILGQQEPTRGEIRVGPSVRIGTYAQEHETLDYSHTLIETVRRTAPLTEEQAVSFLGRFLFSYEQARGVVGNLSGGERSRLQMALLMLSGANLLLLDEPTNNLDITSIEVLEEALADFEGTVLAISHDRYFLDRVVDRIVELEGRSLTEYVGGYSDYQEKKKDLVSPVSTTGTPAGSGSRSR